MEVSLSYFRRFITVLWSIFYLTLAHCSLVLANEHLETVSIAEQQEIKNRKIDSLNNLSYSTRQADAKQSLLYAIEALELSSAQEYQKGYADAMHNRGTARSLLGQNDLGITDLLEAARMREELQDAEGLTTTYNNIGYAFANLGNDRKAQEFFNNSLESSPSKFSRHKGVILNNIGRSYVRTNDYEKALEYFNMSLTNSEELGDERSASASLSYIGTVHNHVGDYQKALTYHLKALEMAEASYDKALRTYIYHFIADDYLALKRYDEATAHSKKSLELAREMSYVHE